MQFLNDGKLFLPLRWDGVDFQITLEKLFRYYINRLKMCNRTEAEIRKVERICHLILQSVEVYLSGFTAFAYDSFRELMDILKEVPLEPEKHSFPQLFRMVGVQENRIYPRTRVFHVPYTLRAKVSAGRYSIAGCPSLYLGTSLELCSQEVDLDLSRSLGMASRFEIQGEGARVIEMALKPQDFFTERGDMLKEEVGENYLLWYPVIAASSFMCVNRDESFRVEYIVPQLLMQWVRSEMTGEGLIGLRYFSCVSVRSSNMGFNYIFPASGRMLSASTPYCPVLTRFFTMTDPVFLQEYENLKECEEDLIYHCPALSVI